MSDILSVSRLKAARACLRLDRYRYVEGFRATVDNEDARFGTLIHIGLEAWWNALAAGAADQLAAATVAVRAETNEGFELVKAEELLAGYDARWRDEKYEVISVEQEFFGPLVNPLTGAESRVWRRGGKLDVMVRAPDGRKLFVEHKTSSEDISQGSEYWRRLRIDGQVSTYFEGARILGHEVDGCLYDVIGKPGIRPLKATLPESRKYKANGQLYANQRENDETAEEYRRRLMENIAESPGRYYQREVVVRLEDEMREALLDDWHFGQTLREAIRLGRAPRNADACVRYGKTCEFFDVCTGVASLEDKARFVRTDNVHPELTLHLAKEDPRP